MAFRRISGKPKIEWYPVTTSTAFSLGALAYWGGSGLLIPADSTSGDHAGITLRAIASTDSDYATARKIPVDVPNSDDIFEVDVENGTLTTAMIGNQYDLYSDDGINVSAQSKKVVTVVGFVSATKALVKINAVIGHANVATT